MTENTEALKGEQTLAHLLEFLSRLDSSQKKVKVITEIEQKVKGYVKDDDKFSSTTNGYLLETIKKSSELRTKIVKTDGTYKYYKSQFNEYNHDYAKHLINNVFALFGCLYYMYYECAQQCYDIKGAEWYNESCDGKSHGKNLNHWLTHNNKDTHMISRGFKDIPLSQMTGKDLFPKSEAESLLDFSNGAQLQFALYYMLFLPSPGHWNDAQSGHAVLFLEALCKMVSENKFNGQYPEAEDGTFKSACQTVEQSVNTLTGLKIIVPVAHNSNVQYKQLLTPEHFWEYIRWLKENLKNLIESLKEMESDAKNWSQESLKTSKSFGPYPWGFTFRNHNWESKTGQIKQPVSQLTEALESFKEKVQSLSATQSKGHSEKAAETPSASIASNNSTTSPTSTVSTTSTTSADSTTSNNSTNSPASTVGSVIGGVGAAAATAGAAYAGSGFLGPVAEGIGKFFKGLFF